MSLAGKYARLAGLLKSDLTTIEVELNVALQAWARGDLASVRAALVSARDIAALAQSREEDHAGSPTHASAQLTLPRPPAHQPAR